MKEIFNKNELISKFKNRLESRPIIQGDIYFDTRLMTSIIKKSDVKREYDTWVRSLAERSLFLTECGNIPLLDIHRLWIELFRVYILKGEKQYPVLSPDSGNGPLKVNGIEEVELQITKDVKSRIKEKEGNLIALPDLTVILNEVCSDLLRKTSYENTEAIRKRLMSIDETKELLDRMSYELFLDLKTIFDDLPIYWGRSEK